jgi:hypothetical protein
MSNLMMNIHTCVTDNTTNTLLYVRSLCQITMSDLMMNILTRVTVNLLTACCMSDQYICFNDECTRMFY